MEKQYTVFNGIHVLPDPGENIPALELDSCLAARRRGKLYIHPLDALRGKEVEQNDGRWADPVFGYSRDEGETIDRFLVVGGKRRDAGFCGLCRDRLNGITGNCFDSGVKPKGCSFDPAADPGIFRIRLDGWTKLRPWEVNRSSPFKKPWSADYISLDPCVIRRNRKARKVRANFGFFLRKKEEKFCARCVHSGLCHMSCLKIAEHCMVTEEKTLSKCLRKIQRKFGSAGEFLNRLAYSGSMITHRPRKSKRRTPWMVFRPDGKNHFLARKPSRPRLMTRVTLGKVKRSAEPRALPSQNPERIAALAWFFMEKYCARNKDFYWGYRGRTLRILSITPEADGIEVSYYPYGWRLSLHTRRLCSFNDVLRFER